MVHALTEAPKASGLARLVREPLVQFLTLGFILFLGFSWFAPETGVGIGVGSDVGSAQPGMNAAEAISIRVDRDALLAFVQVRTQEPDAEQNARAFDALGREARRQWIHRFVREEALVREAKALGLDRDDELIRRRLVQKIEFLTGGLIEETVDVSEEALEELLRMRPDVYGQPTLLAFTHVFVSSKNGSAVAEKRAGLLGAQLNRARLGPQAALSLGERFLYNRSYADRTIDEVRSHFGAAFAEGILETPVDPTVWTNPLESEHGWHVVLLTRRIDARIPTVGEIASTLRTDLRNERRDEALERSISEIVSKYRVEVGPGLEERL